MVKPLMIEAINKLLLTVLETVIKDHPYIKVEKISNDELYQVTINGIVMLPRQELIDCSYYITGYLEGKKANE